MMTVIRGISISVDGTPGRFHYVHGRQTALRNHLRRACLEPIMGVALTQSAINILESEYSAKGNSFDELLRLEKELIDYDLKILKAIVQSHQAKNQIEKFILFE